MKGIHDEECLKYGLSRMLILDSVIRNENTEHSDLMYM